MPGDSTIASEVGRAYALPPPAWSFPSSRCWPPRLQAENKPSERSGSDGATVPPPVRHANRGRGLRAAACTVVLVIMVVVLVIMVLAATAAGRNQAT